MVKSVTLWVITGYDGVEAIFERRLPWGAVSERAMIELLSRLAARHLTPQEVVAASLRRGVRGRSTLLEVQKDAREPGSYCLMTTGNPHYTARVVSSVDWKVEARKDKTAKPGQA